MTNNPNINLDFSNIQERALAKIVELDDVIKHPHADLMELAIVGYWQCCVKVKEFKKGDKAIYCEVDAMVPLSNPLFTFLEARKESVKTVGEANYSRIKTIKLRKEYSQGLLVPVPDELAHLPVGTNVTSHLGILKYEKTEIKPLTGYTVHKTWFGRLVEFISGGEAEDLLLPFPHFLKKSDQERVQNLRGPYARAVESGEDFEMTYKLNGSSMTPYLIVKDGQIRQGVCSREREIKTKDVKWTKTVQLRQWLASLLSHNRRMFKVWRFIVPSWRTGYIARENQFVKAYFDINLDKRLLELYNVTGLQVAVQGELIGPGIQDNFEGVPRQKFYIYAVYVLGKREDDNGFEIGKQLPTMARFLAKTLQLDYTPLLGEKVTLPPDFKDCLLSAEGKRFFSGKPKREGVVYKSNSRDFSFKVISNAFLLDEE